MSDGDGALGGREMDVHGGGEANVLGTEGGEYLKEED